MRALTATQLEVLFESSRDTRWHPLWVLLGTVGLRIGEALGLKWSDVDLVAGRLKVKRALQRQRGRGLAQVRRQPAMHKHLEDRNRRARGPTAETDGELVFPNRDGDAQESSTVTDALKVVLIRPDYPQFVSMICDTRPRPSCSRLACI